MLPLPRVAAGTFQAGADSRAILWALIETLRQAGLQVQSFLSRAHFAQYRGHAAATGVSPRHLDSWLMSPELCREAFFRGAQGCDLALVEGEFAVAAASRPARGGSLDVLCDWLDLPRLGILDASRLGGCRLPERPRQLDGLLLDRVADPPQLAALATNVEALWNVPVLGALEELPALRAAADALPPGSGPSRRLCEALAANFRLYSRPRRIVELGLRRGLAWVSSRLCAAHVQPVATRIALAYDDAINCYFPDTLDLLEWSGATVVDFSPLKDERLPEGTDIVYLGCGHPERFAERLSQNHCMKLALRNHVRSGGRVYGEGGGLAYLCQHLEADDGSLWRMAGVFPALARPCPPVPSPEPVEATAGHSTWLLPSGARLRGYRNPKWRLEPAGQLVGCLAEAEHRFDLVSCCQAVGSQLHLNFSTASLVAGFLRTPPVLSRSADPWVAVP